MNWETHPFSQKRLGRRVGPRADDIRTPDNAPPGNPIMGAMGGGFQTRGPRRGLGYSESTDPNGMIRRVYEAQAGRPRQVMVFQRGPLRLQPDPPRRPAVPQQQGGGLEDIMRLLATVRIPRQRQRFRGL